jgi:hypothetical protein
LAKLASQLRTLLLIFVMEIFSRRVSPKWPLTLHLVLKGIATECHPKTIAIVARTAKRVLPRKKTFIPFVQGIQGDASVAAESLNPGTWHACLFICIVMLSIIKWPASKHFTVARGRNRRS